jgi:hypothetical protein
MEEVRESWTQLADDTLKMKDKGEVVLLGDFNARVGSAAGSGEVIGQFGEPNGQDMPNANGSLMINFLNNIEMMSLGSRDASIKGPAYTWHRPSMGQKSIIDYILVDSKLFSSSNLPNLHITVPQLELTDHAMLYTILDRQAFRRPVTPAPISLRWKLDRLEVEKHREAYQKAIVEQTPTIEAMIGDVRVKLSAVLLDASLTHADRKLSVEARVSTVAKAVEDVFVEAAEKHIGSKRVRPGQSKSFWDAEVQASWGQGRKLWAEYLTISNQGGEGEAAKSKYREYSQHRKSTKVLIRTKETTRMVQLTERLNQTNEENNCHKTPASARELWAQVKKQTKNQPAARVSAIRDAAGVLQHSAEGKATALGQFFKNLADVPTYELDPSFRQHADFHNKVKKEVATFPEASKEESNQGWAGLGDDISTEEVEAVLKHLKHRKSGSPNSRLVGELLKYSGKGGCELITALLSLMWQFECKPSFMKMGYVVSIFKKGDTEDPGNYRPLSMLHVIGKVYSKIINQRIMEGCEEHEVLHEAQNGFRWDRRCEDHLVTLKEVLAGRLEAGESTFLYSTDVFKAYDTCWRDGLFYTLWQAGIKGKMFRVLQDMYQGTRSVATYDGKQSKEGSFDVKMGLAQGDPLSPTLFALFINPLLVNIEERCVGVPLGESGTNIHSLLFADDQIGLSASKEHTDTLVSVVDDHCAQWKIKLNKKKGWVMVLGPEHEKFAEVPTWGTTQTPIVNKAVYLGGTLDYKLQTDTHPQAQLKKAEAKVGMLSKFFNNRRVHAGLRQLVLDSLVKPTLEMGTAVFAPTKATAVKMQAVYSNAQKKIVGAHRGTSGRVVGLEMGSRPLNSWRLQQQLHIGKRLHDMKQERLTKRALKAEWPKSRKGKNLGRWVDVQEKALQQLKTTAAIFEDPAENVPEDEKVAFKTQVEELIQKADARQLKADSKCSSTLASFLDLSSSHPKTLAPYLDGPTGKGASLLLLCRSGSLLTNNHTKNWTRGSTLLSNTCPSCNQDTPETMTHLLFHCPAYQTSNSGIDRDRLGGKITQLLNPDQATIWNSLPEKDREQMMLGDTWVGGETHKLHKALKLYLQNSWNIRQSIVHAPVALSVVEDAIAPPPCGHMRMRCPAMGNGPPPATGRRTTRREDNVDGGSLPMGPQLTLSAAPSSSAAQSHTQANPTTTPEAKKATSTAKAPAKASSKLKNTPLRPAVTHKTFSARKQHNPQTNTNTLAPTIPPPS